MTMTAPSLSKTSAATPALSAETVPAPGAALKGIAFEVAKAAPTPDYIADATGNDTHEAWAAKGFFTAGLHTGVKRKKKDLALIYSEFPAVAAGVFTTNVLRAAPVLVSELHLKLSGTTRAIVCNSGNANACTGDQGLLDAQQMADAAAHALGIQPEEVLVSSTGVIGQPLPIDLILTGISQAAQLLTNTQHRSAVEAIMTTDTFAKSYAVDVTLTSGKQIRIGAIAKGSGMICPNMATMLAFVTTDAAIEKSLLQSALLDANELSFNRITVDGDTSTNDMALVLANGAADAEEIVTGSENFVRFKMALQRVLTVLAKLIVVDGEGATKLIEIVVSGAKTETEAAEAAKTIANSNLFKTAMHGEDANWGRIIAALGRSGVKFNPAQVEIALGDMPVLQKNYKVDFSEARAKEILSEPYIKVGVCLNDGAASATVWTCDLSAEYVRINGSYRT